MYHVRHYNVYSRVYKKSRQHADTSIYRNETQRNICFYKMYIILCTHGQRIAVTRVGGIAVECAWRYDGSGGRNTSRGPRGFHVSEGGRKTIRVRDNGSYRVLRRLVAGSLVAGCVSIGDLGDRRSKVVSGVRLPGHGVSAVPPTPAHS